MAGITRPDTYGHEAGTQLEDWLKRKLEELDWDVNVYFPNELATSALRAIATNSREPETIFQSSWWGPLLVKKKQLTDFARGTPLQRWQQEAADIIIHYGADLFEGINDVVLLNVKSHSVARESRPPNIVSGQRLLEFLHGLLAHRNAALMLHKMNLWFVGIPWEFRPGVGGIVRDVHIRDLFKLDVTRIPQINFDAAIQIQWHVRDMIEIEQDKLTFVEKLVDTFTDRWQQHVRQKQSKYEPLARSLKERIERLRTSSVLC